MAKGIVGLGGERKPFYFIWFTENSFKFPTKYLYPYPWSSIAADHDQRNFIWQWTLVNEEACNHSICWQYTTEESLALSATLSPLLHNQGILEKVGKKNVRARGRRRVVWNRNFWTWHGHSTQELTASILQIRHCYFKRKIGRISQVERRDISQFSHEQF